MNPEDYSSDEEMSSAVSSIFKTKRTHEWSPFTYMPASASQTAAEARIPSPVPLFKTPSPAPSDGGMP